MPPNSISEELSTDESDPEGDDREGTSRAERLMLIANLWSGISSSGETGATDRATLDEIEREVTEVMYGGTPDINRAESLTCMALHLISGNI